MCCEKAFCGLQLGIFGSLSVLLGVVVLVYNWVENGPGWLHAYEIKGEKHFTFTYNWVDPGSNGGWLWLYADADRTAFSAQLRLSTLQGREAVFLPANGTVWSDVRARAPLNLPFMGHLTGVLDENHPEYELMSSMHDTSLDGTYSVSSGFTTWAYDDGLFVGKVPHQTFIWDLCLALGTGLLVLGACCGCSACCLYRQISRRATKLENPA